MKHGAENNLSNDMVRRLTTVCIFDGLRLLALTGKNIYHTLFPFPHFAHIVDWQKKGCNLGDQEIMMFCEPIKQMDLVVLCLSGILSNASQTTSKIVQT